jgi:predicted RND superfamily exporter protein
VAAGASRPAELARSGRDRKLGIATGLAIAGVGLVQFVLTKELHWSRSVSIGVTVCLITAIVLVSYRSRLNNLKRPS